MPTYLSKEKLEELKEELETRKKVTRREIADRISQAKELGDLAENFEYHEAKDAQGMNESRIQQVEGMILDSCIVEEKTGGDVIQLGVTFEVDLAGSKKTFQIVGASEAKPLEGKISNESPLGNALLGTKVGDEVKLEVPSGTVKYKITKIL